MAKEEYASCDACKEATNCLNGKYCKKMRQYVEHIAEPLCLGGENNIVRQ